MAIREMGRVCVLFVAIMIGGAGTVTAQGNPRPYPGDQPCMRDTIRSRVLGRPVTPGGMMHGGMMSGGMMHSLMPFSGGMSGPSAMLMHRDELGLSPTQVQRLEVLAATRKRTEDEMMPQVLRGVADLMAAASGEVDLDAARKSYDRLSRTVSELLMADLRIKKDARETLTPEQRTRWDAMRDQMGEMMRMMGPMGSMGSMGHMGMMGQMGQPAPMNGQGDPVQPYPPHHQGHHAERCR